MTLRKGPLIGALLALLICVGILAFTILRPGAEAPAAGTGDRSGPGGEGPEPVRAALLAESLLDAPPAADAVARSVEGVEAKLPGVPEDLKARRARQRARMQALAKADNWELIHDHATNDQLQQLAEAIEKSIVESTQAEFDALFAAGRFEVLSQDGVYRGTSESFNPFDVYRVNMLPDGQVQKCTLPEAQFGAIYDARAHSVWLRERIKGFARR